MSILQAALNAGDFGDRGDRAPGRRLRYAQAGVGPPGLASARRGRARSRPDALIGDMAYASRGERAVLRAKRIKTLIPQPTDRIDHRLRCGSAGGRPPAFESIAYRGRNVFERSFNETSNGADCPAAAIVSSSSTPLSDDLATPRGTRPS